MSIWTGIESEFNAIIGDVKSVPEKLEALVGLHSKAQTLAALESALTTIVEDSTKVAADKVSEILAAVGKA